MSAISASAKSALVIRAIVFGLLAALVGAAPLVWLMPLNAAIHPHIPWGAVATTFFLVLYLAWLGGTGWPKSTRAYRRYSLRLWRPEPGAWSGDQLSGTLGIVAAIAAVYVVYVLVSLHQPIPDLSAYPTTAYRFSMLIMGAVVSGVTEEAAFRGYMQSQLERIEPTFAIMLTSAVFCLAHITHGLQALIILAPGYFFIGVLYGMLARRTGSILPGMALHVVGDGAYAFFAGLGGNANLLFAAS